MYQCFVDSARDNGRVYELGLMLKLFLKTNPFAALKLAPVGLGMLLHGRLPMKPSRIKGVGELKAILDKAKALGGAK
jgi:heterodisulfide reductase subunit C